MYIIIQIISRNKELLYKNSKRSKNEIHFTEKSVYQNTLTVPIIRACQKQHPRLFKQPETKEAEIFNQNLKGVTFQLVGETGVC